MKSGYRGRGEWDYSPRRLPPAVKPFAGTPPRPASHRVFGPLLLLRHLIIISYPTPPLPYTVRLSGAYNVFTISIPSPPRARDFIACVPSATATFVYTYIYICILSQFIHLIYAQLRVRYIIITYKSYSFIRICIYICIYIYCTTVVIVLEHVRKYIFYHFSIHYYNREIIISCTSTHTHTHTYVYVNI